MRSIVYRSLPLVSLEGAQILDIMRSAERRNAAEGLSGALFWDAACFVQLLSGPPEALRRLEAAVAADARHVIAWSCDVNPASHAAADLLPMGYLSATDFRRPGGAAALAALRGATPADAPALSRLLAETCADKYPTLCGAARACAA